MEEREVEDSKIIELYWAREQDAIQQTQLKYHGYCYAIAKNILGNREDSEECVNDTWLRTWNAIPPERPNVLRAFLGRITRNIALDQYRRKHAQKRGCGEMSYIYDELQDCCGCESLESQMDRESDQEEITRVLNQFLGGLKRDMRIIFVRRYWYMDSVTDIAKRCGYSESKIKSSLSRLRKKLRTHLEKEGITL